MFHLRLECLVVRWLVGWLVVSSTVTFEDGKGAMEYPGRFVGKRLMATSVFHMNLAAPLSFQRDVLSMIWGVEGISN